MTFPADSNRYKKKKDIAKNVIVLKNLMQFHERSNCFFTFGKSSFSFAFSILYYCPVVVWWMENELKIMKGSFNNKDAYSRKGASVLNWIPGGVFRF